MMSQLCQLEEYILVHLPHIRYVTPRSTDYAELRQAYIINNPAVPLAIVRPQSAEDVASLVRYAVSAGIEITVRTGGHDPFGRCFVQDALAIDMRDIAFVHVTDDKSSATIGGGILTGGLTDALAKQRRATPISTVSSVGYVGWATHGGYGPLSGCFGLGVDQILAAKVVDARGEIVHANSGMLCAIRGAGGTLGVVVELTVKVYSLDKILAGTIVFESRDLAATMHNFESKYRETFRHVPRSLGIQRNTVNTPMGRAFLVDFMWSSPDFQEGQRWLDKISSFGVVLMNGVKETTLPEILKFNEAIIPTSGYGRNLSINAHELSDEILQIVAQEVPKMPHDHSTLFSILEFRGAAAKPNEESVFSPRMPHYLIEFIAISSNAEGTSAAWEWAVRFRDSIAKTDSSNILANTYISLTPPEESHIGKIFQDNRDKLVKIKGEYDSSNVYKHALPQF